MKVTYQSTEYHISDVSKRYIKYHDKDTVKLFEVNAKGYTIRECIDVASKYPKDKLEQVIELKDKAFNQVQL